MEIINNTMEEISIETRIYRGHNVKWMYHDECDDGSSDGPGHMQVVKDDSGSFIYKCKNCGFSVPYDDYDTDTSI